MNMENHAGEYAEARVALTPTALRHSPHAIHRIKQLAATGCGLPAHSCLSPSRRHTHAMQRPPCSPACHAHLTAAGSAPAAPG